MKLQWTFLLGILFAIVISVFAVFNVAPVRVNYFFGTANWPLILVILGSVLVGGFIVFCINAVKFITLQRKIKQLERIIADFEARPLSTEETETSMQKNLDTES
ncbi:lipopolysaccharide assembly LapA domain-containing protein [Peribacillus sp. SCS-155]|uniref:LapA family protein n=1 Tax=Peribacillus sedimenti TaxID=3115297 RepID=UPI003905837B